MTIYDYIEQWRQTIKKQNAMFETSKNWSIDGTKTQFNREKLEHFGKRWRDFINRDNKAGDLFCFYMLIHRNNNRFWINQAVESCLWQVANFPYRLMLIFVIDPPYEEAPKIISQLEEKYSDLADFNIILNKQKMNWSGSYNIALDACKEAGADYALINDSDDVSHPERLNWTYQYLRSNENRKMISFVPIFIYENDYLWNANKVDLWHPHTFDDPLIVFIESCLIYYDNGKGNAFFCYNPNSIGFNKDVINNPKCRFRKEIVEDSPNILFADQLFIYEIMKEYPFGLWRSGKLMLGHRRHDKSFTHANRTQRTHSRSFEWQRILSRQTRDMILNQYGYKLIKILKKHAKQKYSIDLTDNLFIISKENSVIQ